MSPVDYARGRRLLLRKDPVLATLIRAQGPCGLADGARIEYFAALVRSIIFQQLSTKAASTIHARFLGLLPDGRATPPALATLTDDQFRSVGISRQKSMYLRDLSDKVVSGVVALEAVEHLDDEDVIAALTTVKGVGRWTAEMFLMFRLHRPDVLPVGDLGILTAVQRAYGLRKRPTPERLRKLGEAWRPYRSIACWYLWRSLDNGDFAGRPRPRSVKRKGSSSDPPSR